MGDNNKGTDMSNTMNKSKPTLMHHTDSLLRTRNGSRTLAAAMNECGKVIK
jgi:hypothetical protein